MKRLAITVITLLLLISLFSLNAYADGEGAYTVEWEEEGGAYRFLKNGVLASEAVRLDRLLNGMAGLDLPIYLNDVYTDEDIVLAKGSYVLSGALSAKSITVSEGTSLDLSDCTLTLTEGISVNGGTLRISSGRICADGTAVTLGYSSLSTLEMLGGEVLTASANAAILLKSGSAYMKGGRVENLYGVAVEAYTELRLSNTEIKGSNYEIISHAPIFLLEKQSEQRSVRIKYEGHFEQGTSTPVIIGASASDAETFSVVDADGREYQLRDVGGNLAVHLPYTIRLISGSTTVGLYECLGGETISEPHYTPSDGYRLKGWYTDAQGRGRYDFATPVSSDILLYAVCELESPSYALSELDITYDGCEHTLTFTRLTHNLDGIYSYEWYKSDGTLVSTSKSLTVSSVKDSGEYKCKVLFTYGSDSVAFETLPVSVTVRPCIIEPPTVQACEYNGLHQSPLILGSGFIYEPVSFVNAGVYLIELELCDDVNTRWSNSEGKMTSVAFEIKRAENYFIEPLSVNDAYIGTKIAASACARFGSVRVLFSLSPDGVFTEEVPSAIGGYYARAVVEGSSDYMPLYGDAVHFNILEDRIVLFTVNSYPVKSVYRSFERLDTEGLTFLVAYASGESEILPASEVEISYPSFDCFRLAHSFVVASYGGHSTHLPVTVLPAEYDISLVFEGDAVVFDGAYHTLTLVGKCPVGLDGIPLNYRVVGGGSDAGLYTVTLEFFTDSIEYNPPPPLNATLEILPLTVAVNWSDCDFVYDGTVKCPTAFYTDINGARISLPVLGAASLAGNGYIAHAVMNDSNYLPSGDKIEYSIQKATYDLSGVRWNADCFVYSGEEHTVSLEGLPSGVSVVGYINASVTDAGEYTAMAVLSYDAANYLPPQAPSHSYTVLPAAYDLSGFSFTGGEIVYDGAVHYPVLVGVMPDGIDGSRLSYSFSQGVLYVTDEPVVTVNFHTNSKNYIAPDPITVDLRIIPRGIYVAWSNTELIYNGRLQSPIPSSEYCIVYTEGGAADAGIYTAAALTDNTNFVILNPNTEYRISPAENSWTEPPKVGDVFLGTQPSPTASAMFGDVVYEYYTDPSVSIPVSLPLGEGKYYLVARANAGSNYKPLCSEPIPFNVVPIIPIAIRADGREDFVAFERIGPTDITVILVNNDGSERTLSFGELVIEYERGSTLLANDTSVTIRSEGLSLLYPLSVGRADYDMTGAVWSGLTVVYDGNMQYPTLSGLPDGITVVGYSGVGVSAAGEYSIGAILAYDSENYNEPPPQEATLCILKRGITPYAATAVYNGAPRRPIAKSDLYSLEEVEYTDAGTYLVTATLFDTDNYYLVSETAEFVITPAVIAVRVNDAHSYWLDPPTEFGLSFLDGFFATEEELLIEYYIENGAVYARAQNPNYSLSVEAGRVIKHNRFSPKLTRVLFICFLLFVILASGIMIIILRRDLIAGACRRIFKGSRVVATGGDEVRSDTEEYISVDERRADELITDTIARTLIYKEEEAVITDGSRRYVVNLDTINAAFDAKERVDINTLKARGLVPSDAGYLKILARGTVSKPLSVYANAFSLCAVKMLALTGGEAHIVKNK